jgi:8-amino-7-oxononanoate synthase
VIARARGATVHRFRSGDVRHAERLLRGPAAAPRVLCMDGGQLDDRQPARPARLRRPGPRARRPAVRGRRPRLRGHRGAHRLRPQPDGRKGNAVVRWFGESSDHVVLAAGFSKAYSSLLAFLAFPTTLKRYLKVMVPSYVYGGPVRRWPRWPRPCWGLEVNRRRGDDLRAQLHHRTRLLLDHLDKLGVATSNVSGFPLVELALADAADLDAVGRHLFDRGIYVTPWPLPGGPRQGGRLPHPADRGQHPRPGRPPADRPPGGRRPLRAPPPLSLRRSLRCRTEFILLARISNIGSIC